MLYGGSSWSELPISTSLLQVQNGEAFEYGLLIDEAFAFSGTMDSGFIQNLNLTTQESFSCSMTEVSGLSFEIQLGWSSGLSIDSVLGLGNLDVEREQGFSLDIDKNNTWSLS